MTNTNKFLDTISAYVNNTLDPKTLQKFVNRPNKKDSFTRWFQKNGSI